MGSLKPKALVGVPIVGLYRGCITLYADMPLKMISVEEEFAKNKELKKEDVDLVIEWMQKQPHLPKITELEIILFLHSCGYKQEATKTTIDTYYTIRTHCPEFFSNRIPNESFMKFTDICLYYPLPVPTNEGYKVIYARIVDPDASKFIFSESLKVFTMMIDTSLLSEGTAPGHIILFDMQGISLSHLPKLGIMTMKKYMIYLQEAMPIRLKGLHYINVVPFMDKILALMKPFMKKELLDVLHLHTDGLDSLYKFVPNKCLPKDIGGESATIKEMHANMKHTLLYCTGYFKEELKDRVDETKRPGKAKDAGELFGVEGSFKKLDID